jgi:phage terminase large subunit GpA-like protein
MIAILPSPVTEEISRDHWAPNVVHRDKRSPSLWASEERWIAAGQSPLSKGRAIRYDHAIAPHAVQPMNDADDPRVNLIVLWFGRRMMKTEGVCANIVGRTVTDDPGNVYCMGPTDDSVYQYSRDMLEPMIEATPCLREVFVEKKSRDTGRTLDYKRYLGGSIYIVNAGSPSKMRGMAAKVVLIREVDAFPRGTKNEGDPIEKALGRAEGFGDAIKIIESTGTLAPGVDENGETVYRSNIHEWHDRGDQMKYFLPCRRCDHLQYLQKVTAPGTCEVEGLWAPSGRLDKAVYLCRKCEADHNEAQWREMVRRGVWKAIAPFRNGIRSYWISGFNSLLPTGKGFKTKLHQFMAEAERANHSGPEAKRVWINEVACDLWDPEGESEPAPDWRKIFDRRESY